MEIDENIITEIILILTFSVGLNCFLFLRSLNKKKNNTTTTKGNDRND